MFVEKESGGLCECCLKMVAVVTRAWGSCKFTRNCEASVHEPRLWAGVAERGAAFQPAGRFSVGNYGGPTL